MSSAPNLLALAPILEDLGVDPSDVRAPGTPTWDAGPAQSVVLGTEEPAETTARIAAAKLGPSGRLLLHCPGDPDAASLARWRDALWPLVHVGVLYRMVRHEIRRETLQGVERLSKGTGLHGVLLVGERRERVLSPASTVAKFDQNAPGWSGEPGRPGYAHFRWMRRYVARYAGPVRPRRILDFGCGAGWVGIEAALAAPGAELAAFDPSPEMVRIAGENARMAGIARFEGRTGFGEDPPFPADGEALFDLVLSSGVISFSPDTERFLDGLVRTLAPGGTLVVGDLNPASRGMRARRAKRPLLPVREMNAPSFDDVRRGLVSRGLTWQAGAFYQLTSPVPEAMHVSERRLGGALSRPLLWANQAASAAYRAVRWPPALSFDSWVLRFVRV